MPLLTGSAECASLQQVTPLFQSSTPGVKRIACFLALSPWPGSPYSKAVFKLLLLGVALHHIISTTASDPIYQGPRHYLGSTSLCRGYVPNVLPLSGVRLEPEPGPCGLLCPGRRNQFPPCLAIRCRETTTPKNPFASGWRFALYTCPHARV